MSAKWTFWAWEQDIKTAPKKLALLQLANNANDDGISWYSIGKMAIACGVSDRTLQRQIQSLEDDGLLIVERRSNRPSIYKLNDGIEVTLKDNERCQSVIVGCQSVTSRGVRESHDPNSNPNNYPNNKIIVPTTLVPKQKDAYPAEFNWLWDNKPDREGGNPKKQAYSACKARLKEGSTWREMAEGLNRYKSYCHSRGLVNTAMVQQMSTFFGTKEGFKESWGVLITQEQIEVKPVDPEKLKQQQQSALDEMMKDF